MTKPALTKFNRMIEYSSIALGVVLGVIYLDPMTINSTKSDLTASVKSMSQFDTTQSFETIQPAGDFKITTSTKPAAKIILASK
jgi:hypothetical protein